ncbi:MAG: hypothetical protein KAS72_01490 [Phycisphaerales bacterium]|nr:hypothetical protein [Phycisphaerales bacterium]
MPHLFAKLLSLVLCFALIGLCLVVMRQQRYVAAAQITRQHADLQAAEQTIWQLQATLAQRITPERIAQLAGQHELTEPRTLPAGDDADRDEDEGDAV